MEHAKWLRGEGGERANLRDATLSDATLSGANLRDANLRHATLSGADLSDADLSDANLSYANLRHANPRHAYLHHADLRGAKLPHYQLPRGDLRVYKKAGGKIVHLLIPRHVQRTASLIGRKCRAAAAYVLAIEGDKPVTSEHQTSKTYIVGEWVYPDSYDPDPRVECSHGIHFFLTREEAEEW
jgi:hypothetical protein